MCQALLRRDDLHVSHEDFIFRAIGYYIKSHPDISPQEASGLWVQCRFAQLSPDCLATACHTTGIPLYALTEGAVAKLLADSEQGTVSAYQEYVTQAGTRHDGTARFQARAEASHPTMAMQ